MSQQKISEVFDLLTRTRQRIHDNQNLPSASPHNFDQEREYLRKTVQSFVQNNLLNDLISEHYDECKNLIKCFSLLTQRSPILDEFQDIIRNSNAQFWEVRKTHPGKTLPNWYVNLFSVGSFLFGGLLNNNFPHFDALQEYLSLPGLVRKTNLKKGFYYFHTNELYIWCPVNDQVDNSFCPVYLKDHKVDSRYLSIVQEHTQYIEGLVPIILQDSIHPRSVHNNNHDDDEDVDDKVPGYKREEKREQEKGIVIRKLPSSSTSSTQSTQKNKYFGSSSSKTSAGFVAAEDSSEESSSSSSSSSSDDDSSTQAGFIAAKDSAYSVSSSESSEDSSSTSCGFHSSPFRYEHKKHDGNFYYAINYIDRNEQNEVLAAILIVLLTLAVVAVASSGSGKRRY